MYTNRSRGGIPVTIRELSQASSGVGYDEPTPGGQPQGQEDPDSDTVPGEIDPPAEPIPLTDPINIPERGA